MSSPGRLTHFVVYAVALTVMYFARTPEITGNFTENQASHFHVAAVRLKAEPNKGGYAAYSLAQLNSGKVDLASLSFLLPQDVIASDALGIVGHDTHRVRVLERHPDWQLVEYQYGNTHDSVSRYRAFKDRIEPVSYRVTMHMGLMLAAIVLLFPAWIVGAIINAIWNAIARRRTSNS